jgi:hypothetical protein
MPALKMPEFSFGGVDSRSNPTNMPPNRALRCINWAPQASGGNRLRLGYSVPTGATNDGFPIHSAAYYEQFSANFVGPQFVMYGKESSLNSENVITGAITAAGKMGSTNPWGHYRAGNKMFFGTGAVPAGTLTPWANGDMLSWDGTLSRPVGLPIPTVGTSAAMAISAFTGGSIAPTQLSGYQAFVAYYNPNTGHVGSRVMFGTVQTCSATADAFVFTGIPAPGTLNAEWVTIPGMTNDGGQVPYWLMDASNNHIIFGNTATNGTISVLNPDFFSELPFRNGVPPKLDKFARVVTRIFGGLAGSPFIYYSNDMSDVTNGNYVGLPEESWPLNQAEAFPTGELPTSLHGHRFEGYFFSLNNLAIWSYFLQQQQANPWRGPWEGGCPGQRAFVMTPYGPFWLTGKKELVTFIGDGVVSVSEEYEAGLLGKLGSKYLNLVEIAYERDPEQLIDQIVIHGYQNDGVTEVFVVHDFRLRDAQSAHGQGYVQDYTAAHSNAPIAIQCFVGAGFTPRQNAKDVNGKEVLWAGTSQGQFVQLDNGNSDNGTTYSADYVGLINMGENMPSLVAIEIQGDDEVECSYLTDYSLGLDGFTACNQVPLPIGSDVQTKSRFDAEMVGETSWLYFRAQLTAHPADGDFDLTDPPFLPLPTYGAINKTVLKTGAMRKEAR